MSTSVWTAEKEDDKTSTLSLLQIKEEGEEEGTEQKLSISLLLLLLLLFLL